MGKIKRDIHEATRSYEQWLKTCTDVVQAELTSKHEQMKDDEFLFLRGTYYRWAQLWPVVCEDLAQAPKVLGCGDLHAGSFGTWRDEEGRLCWGVDDFDNAYPLPYTNDLVRLACSVKILQQAEQLSIPHKEGCEAILEGYRTSLREGGCPIVLAEEETNLAKLGIDAFEYPPDFWSSLEALPAVRDQAAPREARNALQNSLPDARMDFKIVRREAGLGSLGQPRFIAVGKWCGGFVAREAKSAVPAATSWLAGQNGNSKIFYNQAIGSAIRSADPYQKVSSSWLIRRLSPDSNPIEIADLPKKRDEGTLLQAMGTEVANVHLGSTRQTKNILKDLNRRKGKWLRAASRDMAKHLHKDWKEYRDS